MRFTLSFVIALTLGLSACGGEGKKTEPPTPKAQKDDMGPKAKARLDEAKKAFAADANCQRMMACNKALKADKFKSNKGAAAYVKSSDNHGNVEHQVKNGSNAAMLVQMCERSVKSLATIKKYIKDFPAACEAGASKP